MQSTSKVKYASKIKYATKQFAVMILNTVVVMNQKSKNVYEKCTSVTQTLEVVNCN